MTFFDVLRYDGKTGDFIDVFAEVPDNRAYGLEFGPDGRLYIGHWDFGDGVLQFDGQSGELIDIVVPGGLAASRASASYTSAPMACCMSPLVVLACIVSS